MPTSRKRRSEFGRRVVSMDAPGPMDPRHVPKGMTPDRAYRWCLARTTRDLRESIRHNRPITLPTLRRLFARRWLNVSRQCRPAAGGQTETAGVQRGERAIRRMYRERQLCRAPGMTSRQPLLPPHHIHHVSWTALGQRAVRSTSPIALIDRIKDETRRTDTDESV